MRYTEIYDICEPVIQWIKEHYPNNYSIVIDKNGAELIERRKLTILDKKTEQILNASSRDKTDDLLNQCKDAFDSEEAFEKFKKSVKKIKDNIGNGLNGAMK